MVWDKLRDVTEDKLAMRMRMKELCFLLFVLYDHDINTFADTVSPPWV
jgi:hypothetical protein